MSPEKSSKPTKLCPTCGTRVSEDSARCLVCGTDLSSSEKTSRPAKAVQGSRMPEITMSLPAALGLLALFLTIGAVLVYFALRQTTGQAAAEPSATPTITQTVTPTLSPTPVTPTITSTSLPSPTPQVYVVKEGDSCGGIAYTFSVSVQAIILENPDLSANCTISVGQRLFVPHPTPTASPPPTATMSAAESTEAACEKADYTVQENDTLGGIATNYAVPIESIREHNGLVNDVVRFGQKLTIPLCRRESTPGPSPSPTPPPPYAGPNLLLPPDGAPFTLTDEAVSLQWASVGTLRENEAYAVTIEDVTEGLNRKQVEYVVDTKFIVPVSFRPDDTLPHVIRWYVLTVRQTGTDEEGNPVWEPAGNASAPRVFTWAGVGSAITPTP